MFKIKKIHKYILIGFFIIVAVLWTVANLKCRVIIKDNIFTINFIDKAKKKLYSYSIDKILKFIYNKKGLMI